MPRRSYTKSQRKAFAEQLRTKTAEQVAKAAKRSPATVCTWAREFGIAVRNSTQPDAGVASRSASEQTAQPDKLIDCRMHADLQRHVAERIVSGKPTAVVRDYADVKWLPKTYTWPAPAEVPEWTLIDDTAGLLWATAVLKGDKATADRVCRAAWALNHVNLDRKRSGGHGPSASVMTPRGAWQSIDI